VQNSIALKISLRCYARKDHGCWIAVCPSLDVHSQGINKKDAVASIREAVQLWFESCIERAVLPKALQELGFRTYSKRPPEGVDSVELDGRQEDESVLGSSFPVTISIPAYQAALLSSDKSCATC
jgi:predicted RNase H-like HicB family nuclease